jgi:hypothetical protein
MRNPSYIKVLFINNTKNQALRVAVGKVEKYVARKHTGKCCRYWLETRQTYKISGFVFKSVSVFWKGLFLGVVLKCKIAGGPSVSVGMWPFWG